MLERQVEQVNGDVVRAEPESDGPEGGLGSGLERKGDILVYYAAGHRVLPAVMEVTSDQVHDNGDDRFRCQMHVRPLTVLLL